jgi:hypothetical protein
MLTSHCIITAISFSRFSCRYGKKLSGHRSKKPLPNTAENGKIFAGGFYI